MKYLYAIFFCLFIFSSCDYGLEDGNFSPSGIYSGEELEFGGEFQEFTENPFIVTADSPVSTFSVDADGANFAILRKAIQQGFTLPPYSIRLEELVNYFPFNYPDPVDGHLVGVNGEIANCPWTSGNKLIRIGLQGKRMGRAELPPSNMVLLIDVSGSMQSEDKLDLVKNALKLFVDQMRADDKIALVVYAGNDRVVLESTQGSEKQRIKNAIDDLTSGGGTAGEAGIKRAYEIASKNWVEGGNNRVILVSDGDFNVGAGSVEELVALIEEKRESGIYLTTIGVGTGNFNDAVMEQLADNGNGTYEYLDNLEQAKKVFIYELEKMYTIAKDVKVQVEFNPNLVKSYRLIGYENRLLESTDFEDDKKDAGEIGVGQSITAFYEIIPVDMPANRQEPAFHIDFRYKRPDSDMSEPIALDIMDNGKTFEQGSEAMRFGASIIGAGLLLRDSPYKGRLTKEQIVNWANNAKAYDPYNFKTKAVSEVLQKLP